MACNASRSAVESAVPSAQLTDMFVDLNRVHEHLVALVDARLAVDCGLTLGRFEVLSVIARDGSCRVNDIADELGITWGGTSKIVDRLEAARLCERRPNPHDGRSSLIEVTAAGRRSLTKAAKAINDELKRLIGPVLNARALAQFSSACRTLRNASCGAAENVAAAQKA